MKSVKIFSILLLGFIAVFAAFCTKETATPLKEQVASVQGAVTDRGASCTVNVAVSGGRIDLCGTQNTATTCISNGGQNLFGTASQGNNTNVDYELEVPATLKITTDGANPFATFTVTVTTAKGQQVYQLAANQSVDAKITDDCEVF